MMKNRWTEAYEVIVTLENAGFEAFVVGGAVRDFVRNVEANDVDVTTDATPNDVKKLFNHTIDVGIEHGTVLVVLNDTIEVTTFRSETAYTDFRRPDEVIFVRSLHEDLQRRDFTMNAMALSKEDELIDYFGGKEDIEDKIIRAVGDPDQRFSEDALRMLRAVRFSAQLNFSLHHNTVEAIQSLHYLIGHVSMERVKVELEKIWMSDYVANGMELFVTSKLAENFKGDWTTYRDSWRKFESYSNSANGWAFFALMQSRQEISNLLTYFKCSNLEKAHVKNVLNAVEQLKKGYWSSYDFFLFSEEVLIVSANYANEILKLDSPYTSEQIQRKKATLPMASTKELVVNGNDLMEWSKKKRGPWIKEAIENIVIAIINEELPNDRNRIKEWFCREYID